MSFPPSWKREGGEIRRRRGMRKTAYVMSAKQAAEAQAGCAGLLVTLGMAVFVLFLMGCLVLAGALR